MGEHRINVVLELKKMSFSFTKSFKIRSYLLILVGCLLGISLDDHAVALKRGNLSEKMAATSVF